MWEHRKKLQVPLERVLDTIYCRLLLILNRCGTEARFEE